MVPLKNVNLKSKKRKILFDSLFQSHPDVHPSDPKLLGTECAVVSKQISPWDMKSVIDRTQVRMSEQWAILKSPPSWKIKLHWVDTLSWHSEVGSFFKQDLAKQGETACTSYHIGKDLASFTLGGSPSPGLKGVSMQQSWRSKTSPLLAGPCCQLQITHHSHCAL